MPRKLRYAIEGFFILLAFAFFRLLPMDLASSLAGSLGQIAGPFTRAHRTARGNLERAMPELDAGQRARVLSDMWDNLGRVIGEYPHLMREAFRKRITIEGREHLERVRSEGGAILFVSGHFANWEIAPLSAAMCDSPLVVIYREANNPVAEWLIRKVRAPYTRAMHGKGRNAAVQAVKTLKEGRALAMLVDQKVSGGSAIPFFGQTAMTTITPMQLAIKYQVPLLVARPVRTNGVHFHVTLAPPIYFAADASPQEAMAALHQTFESWIREKPAQWFWVHRRWG